MKYSPYLDLNRDVLTLEELMREYQQRGQPPVPAGQKLHLEQEETAVTELSPGVIPIALPKAS